MRLRSFRSRITLWSAAVVAAALFVFGAGAAWNLHNELLEKIDDAIQSEASDFFEALAQHPVDWSNTREVEGLFDQSKRLHYVQIHDRSGHPLYRSPTLRAHEEFPKVPDKELHDITWEGRTIRYGVFANENGIVLALGTNLNETTETVADLLSAYLLALPVVIILVGIGGWWIAHRALAPVTQITGQADRISASDLHQRLPEGSQDDEFAHLARVLNQMFDRLQKSFEQVTRFTSDAAHELKTPLAIMRAGVEDALTSAQLGPEQSKALTEVIEQSTQLSHIVEGLLFLSRAEDRQLKLQSAKVDLAILVTDLMEDAELLAAPSGITIRADLPQSLMIAGDIRLLRRAVMNLVVNAIKYNHVNGEVAISAAMQGNNIALSIRNTGPGLLPETETRIFERFYRGDSSHSKEVQGYGLGLNIAREIARAHGGEVLLVRSDPHWTKFVLLLPHPPAKA